MEFTKDIQFNTEPSSNQNLTINYNGFLANSSELTIVYGFGQNWENTTEQKMTKDENGFSIEIKILDFDTFNFCFRGDNNQWDNNSNCNYISQIIPCKEESPAEIEIQKFDINELIEQILEPIRFQKENEVVDDAPVQINSEPIDLGVEIANALSQIKFENQENLEEFSSLDEILSGTIVSEEPVELFEENSDENIENLETALVAVDDPFIVSSRKLSRFYLLRKQIKLAFYKALVKIPNLIFGSQED